MKKKICLFLPLCLTEPVFRVKEVKFSGGVASASSYHHPSHWGEHWRPENAFKRQTEVDNGWHGGGQSVSHSLPLTVWYDFKSRSVRAAEVRLDKRLMRDVNQ